MILKLLIFAIIGILIYKVLGGKFPTFRRNTQEKQLEDDTLVECEKCSTYVTIKESIVVRGKYYCSDECRP